MQRCIQKLQDNGTHNWGLRLEKPDLQIAQNAVVYANTDRKEHDRTCFMYFFF